MNLVRRGEELFDRIELSFLSGRGSRTGEAHVPREAVKFCAPPCSLFDSGRDHCLSIGLFLGRGAGGAGTSSGFQDRMEVKCST